jgi:mRNA interferase RelE/StbE
MAYTVLLAAPARKQLTKLPADARERILLALALLRENPRPPSVKKLSGREDLYRIRVGDCRILYHIEEEQLIVLVVKIGNRRDVYH